MSLLHELGKNGPEEAVNYPYAMLLVIASERVLIGRGCINYWLLCLKLEIITRESCCFSPQKSGTIQWKIRDVTPVRFARFEEPLDLLNRDRLLDSPFKLLVNTRPRMLIDLLVPR
jgi:hypothetical protein